MYAMAVADPLPSFSKTNCCQPLHDMLLQTAVVKVFVLSSSVKAFGVVFPVFGSAPVSLIPGVTLMNEPSAVEIRPDTWAAKSLLPPPPTVFGLDPPARVRGSGYEGGVVHGTSCHSVLGYEALKHPFLGRGDRKSTRLNSSHRCISYAVFCLKKKKQV